jgi:hypothetical protein
MHKFHRVSPRNDKIIIWNGENPDKIYPTIEEEIEIPVKLLEIAEQWYNLSKETGDIGSCVLGAAMYFKYKNQEYIMEPQSCWQGEGSWTKHKEFVVEELKKIGAEEIYYEWGMMD